MSLGGETEAQATLAQPLVLRARLATGTRYCWRNVGRAQKALRARIIPAIEHRERGRRYALSAPT